MKANCVIHSKGIVYTKGNFGNCVQFGMGVGKLMNKLSFETKKEVSLEAAQEMVNHHREVFKTYWR